MTLGIAFGVGVATKPRLERPQLGHCFSTWIDPAFSDEERLVIGAAIVAMIGCTEGEVGFELVESSSAEVRIVKDGARPVGVAYAGLAYPQFAEHVAIGGEIVLHPDWVRRKVVMHELAHIIGFEHPQAPGSVMSDLDIDAERPADVDRVAWRYMAEQPTGAPRPGLVGAATAHHHRPYVVID